MPEKLYCYVDETGQDTRGELFIVGVVALGDDREAARQFLRECEESSGKHKRKWQRSQWRRRLAYIESALSSPLFRERLFFVRYTQTTDYVSCVPDAIARVIHAAAQTSDVRPTIFIDGLAKQERHRVGSSLRRLGVSSRKVRGLRDESDEFIRLSDALAGFVRDALEQQSSQISDLYRDAVRRQVIQDLTLEDGQ